MNNNNECTEECCFECNLVELFDSLVVDVPLEDALRYVLEVALAKDEDEEEDTDELIEETYRDGYRDGFLDGIAESTKKLNAHYESTVRQMLSE